jgi:glucose/arabinose dehydrogenase
MSARKLFLEVLLVAALLVYATNAFALDGQVFASGFSQSLYVTAPAGDNRLFVVEKGGAIRVVSNGSTLATPFLDLSTQVNTDGERGLLGLAFDPDYASSGRFYVNYVDKTTLNTVVARYTVANPLSNVANAGSAQQIISITQPGFNNHKGGWISFRPGDTRNLYIGTGDGGSGNDPFNNGQNTASLLGKMLRIDVSGSGSGYAIPSDNPFVGQAGVREEIWATGLRNPWRNSFDRDTGDFWIADVGQGVREEVDFESITDDGGHNYGWRLREGTVATPGVGGNAPGLTDPVFDYTHQSAGGPGDAITGGYVFRGAGVGDAQGRYFFGDFVSNRVFSFQPGAGGTFSDLREETTALLGGTGLGGLASFGEDGLGNLYLVGINGVIVVMVPEPAGWISLLIGLGLMTGLLSRNRKAARDQTSTRVGFFASMV